MGQFRRLIVQKLSATYFSTRATSNIRIETNTLSSQRTVRMMSSTNEKPKIIAVCQMTATNSKDDNFQTCKSLIESAKAQNALIAFLPEACDYIGESKAETLALSEPLNGSLVKKYCDLARTLRIWLSLGGIHEQVNSEKVQNAHLLIDEEGNIRATYRKTHLFNVDLPEKGIRLMESDYVIPGKEIVPPVSTPVGSVGLSICYDMRFPELSLLLSKMGADILTFPSAFTYATGAAHWETLLKARAIESQCYVVAAAQTGSHNKKRTSWGHAMIVDPWGTVIAQCREGTGLAVAEIDLGYLQQIRKSMPVWSHRRNDLYPKLEPKDKSQDEECNEKSRYQFGQVFVDASTVFYRTKTSIAFTNKKCVLPGHVLVIPIRPARRLLDLKQDELCDLFQAVQKVQYVMEAVHGTSSSTITVQDGEAAGQTIEHVHVHIIPRKPGDFSRNDEIYAKLETHDKEETQWRTAAEMAEEAQRLRSYFA